MVRFTRDIQAVARSNKMNDVLIIYSLKVAPVSADKHDVLVKLRVTMMSSINALLRENVAPFAYLLSLWDIRENSTTSVIERVSIHAGS